MVDKLGRLAAGAGKLMTKAILTTATGARNGVVTAGNVLYENREEIRSVAETAAREGARLGARTAEIALNATFAAGKTLHENGDKIAGVAAGMARTASDTFHDALGLLIPDEEAKHQVSIIENQSRRYRDLSLRFRSKLEYSRSRKQGLLDILVVGGETIGAYADSGKISSDVQSAYELTYPNVSAMRSFSDQVNHLNAEELEGFVAGVKGKLFELQYVRHLNDGQLPDRFTAEIAQSPINQAWDIAIIGPDGSMKDTIQAKATESVSYVKEALKEHPQIDVVTTSEVYSQLLMQGLTEGIINSGVSENALESLVEGDVDEVTMTIDWVPSAVSLALIAFSAYNEKELSDYQRSRRFGERASKSYLAYLAGGTIAVATQTWWIGVIGGIGSRMLLGTGRRKRNRLFHLTQLVKDNEQMLGKLEKLAV